MRLGVAVVAALVAATPARAGIVVLKNGNVFVGHIDEDEIAQDRDRVTVHQPRLRAGERPLRGKQTFARADVRWFSRTGETLTRDYLRHKDEVLVDPKWAQELERLVRELEDARAQVPWIPRIEPLLADAILRME